MDVYLLEVSHKHGRNLSLHATSELAYAALHQYVKDDWEDACPGEPMPEDPDEAIERYFEAMEGMESYDVNAMPVEGMEWEDEPGMRP